MKKQNLMSGLWLVWCLLLLPFFSAPYAASAQTAFLTPETFADLAQQTAGAVVNISAEKVVTTDLKKIPYRQFFETFLGPIPRRIEIRSLGSGFIIDPQGYVITNNHVVAGARRIKVILVGNRQFKAIIKGRDSETDLALIQIVNPPSDLPVLKLGDSDAIRVGDWVLAVGNPFGLSHTVTQGIISAKGRVIGDSPYDKFLQTDALINPGNSGGPLLNLKKEVIGINAAILVTGQGIGFAIPSNIAKYVIPQLQAKGEVIRGMIGVQVQNITPEMATKLGLSEPRGALVVEVNPGLPAAKAGVRAGDIIIDYNGQAIHRINELLGLVADTPPGTEAMVTVLRQGKERKFKVKVAKLTGKAH